MPFTPDKITKQQILGAAKKIESENIALELSIRFDIIINGKAYPPKKVMRSTHEFRSQKHTHEQNRYNPTKNIFRWKKK